MSESQERVESALKELVQEVPFRKITVHELCLRAGISRNTFYSNFADKNDVVRYIFEKNIIRPVRELNTLLSIDDLLPLSTRMGEQMYERLFDDRDFYTKLIGPMIGVDDTFIRAATSVIYDLNMHLLPRVTVLDDENWKTEYAAYFYASSQAMLMQKWVSDGMRITPKDLAGFYSEMTASFWQSISK